MADPTQIRWSSFANRNPTSITELWPPLRFEDRTMSGNKSNINEDHLIPQGEVHCHREAAHTKSPHIEHERTESLRTFVENEIGIAAIHAGSHLVLPDDTSSSSGFVT